MTQRDRGFIRDRGSIGMNSRVGDLHRIFFLGAENLDLNRVFAFLDDREGEVVHGPVRARLTLEEVGLAIFEGDADRPLAVMLRRSGHPPIFTGLNLIEGNDDRVSTGRDLGRNRAAAIEEGMRFAVERDL